jgi:hypothetical protein
MADDDLFFACVRGDACAVQSLMAAGACANAADARTGQTALMKAAYCASAGGTACVRALLAGGADVQRRDKHGSIAIDWAAAQVPAAAATRAVLQAAAAAAAAAARGADGASAPGAAQPPVLPTSSSGPSFDVTLALEKVLLFGKGLSICPATILRSSLPPQPQPQPPPPAAAAAAAGAATTGAPPAAATPPPSLAAGTLVDVVMHAAGSGGVCTMGTQVVALAARHSAERAAAEAETRRRQQVRKAEREAKKAAKRAKSRKRKGLAGEEDDGADHGGGGGEGGAAKRASLVPVGAAAPPPTAPTLPPQSAAVAQSGVKPVEIPPPAGAPLPLCTKTLYRALTRIALDDGAAKLLHCRAWLQPGVNKRGVQVLHATHISSARLDGTCARACETFALSRLLAARGDESVMAGGGVMAAAEAAAEEAEAAEEEGGCSCTVAAAAADSASPGACEALANEEGEQRTRRCAHFDEKGTRNRHLARWLVRVFGVRRLCTGSGVLDVAGGKGLLSAELSRAAGREVPYTLIEPFVGVARAPGVRHIARRFEWEAWLRGEVELSEVELSEMEASEVSEEVGGGRGSGGATGGSLATLLRDCSVVVGMHPDQATEPIVDFALAHGKGFAVVPCCVFPKLFPTRQLRDGRGVAKYDAFLRFLAEKHHGIRVGCFPFDGKNKVLYLRT